MEAARFHSSIGVFLTAKRGSLQEAIDTYGSLNAATKSILMSYTTNPGFPENHAEEI
jgi:hypothetical protein